MKTFAKILLFSVLCFGFLLFNSCEKDQEISDEELSKLIVDESENAFSFYNDALETYNQESIFLKARKCETCPIVTFNFGETDCSFDMVIDYGTEGCEGVHGWMRKGKILVHVAGCDTLSCQITFDQYSVNGYLINGTEEITFTQNEGENPLATVKINGSITHPDGKVSSLELELTKEWIAGFNTPFKFSDDVFSTTGSGHGVCSEGTEYDIAITSPLIKAMDCQWIQQGEISIAYENKILVKDYGDGTCDSLFTITISDKVKP